MSRLIAMVSAAVLLAAGAAAAAPGDFVAIAGVAQQDQGTRLVIRGDDGAMYLAETRDARGEPVRPGDTVRIAGYVGRRPDEIRVALIEPIRRGPGWNRPDADLGGREESAVVIGGWRLPRTHVYQAQDDRGVYHQVRAQDVPATIARGKEVYDVTALAWVNHPTAYAATDGRNPAYRAESAPEPSRDVVVIEGWRLPRGHAYQAQDDQGVYQRVRVEDVPATIRRGKEVYDLAAKAWVNHPTAYAANGGRNPAYTVEAEPVPTGQVVVIDGWRLPRAHAYQAQDDRGVYQPVRVRDVPATIALGKEVFDLTAKAWVNHPTAFAATGGKNPAYSAEEAAVSPIPGPGWDQLRGAVERVDGSRLLIRADDGKRMVVEAAGAPPLPRLSSGDRVVAVGVITGTGRFDARYVGEERRR